MKQKRIRCSRCPAACTPHAGQALPKLWRDLTQIGWRRVDNETRCPDCVAARKVAA